MKSSNLDFEIVTLVTSRDTVIYAYAADREYDPSFLGYARLARSSWTKSPYSDALEMAELMVRPEHRRHGVATAIFRRAHSWSIENKYPMLMVTAYSPNTAAVKFYESLGLHPHYLTYDTFWKPPQQEDQ